MSNLDFDEFPITEEEVISILGSNFKVQGQELCFRCPACPGGDKHGDNLKYNRQKQVLKCFACDFEKEICEIIARRRFEKNKSQNGQQYQAPQESYNFERKEALEPAEQPVKNKEIAQDDLAEYYMACNYRLMRNKTLLKKIYEKHTILPSTACSCFIGYDDKKDMLVFPSRAAGKDPTDNLEVIDNGAEYREYEGDKVIRRIAGYDAKICAVSTKAFVMHGIICEGYKDAYNLIQIMKMTEPELLNCTAIFTVQNGTNSINVDSCLQKVNWHRFETIGVLLDNDAAGDKATEIAQDLFPVMRDLRKEYISGYNDIQERFAKEFGVNVDIDRALSANWLREYEGAFN